MAIIALLSCPPSLVDCWWKPLCQMGLSVELKSPPPRAVSWATGEEFGGTITAGEGSAEVVLYQEKQHRVLSQHNLGYVFLVYAFGRSCRSRMLQRVVCQALVVSGAEPCGCMESAQCRALCTIPETWTDRTIAELNIPGASLANLERILPVGPPASEAITPAFEGTIRRGRAVVVIDMGAGIDLPTGATKRYVAIDYRRPFLGFGADRHRRLLDEILVVLAARGAEPLQPTILRADR